MMIKLPNMAGNSPPIIFTMDIDFAPETMIEKALNLFHNFQIPLHVFCTHESAVIRKYYARKPEDIGIHPNFLAATSQSRVFYPRDSDVIDYCHQLYPESRSFRCHAMYDNSFILAELKKRGFCYDSNYCAYLQPNLSYLVHATGLYRFPVWWEDDVHLSRYALHTAILTKNFQQHGLKIFNVHPFLVALNIPTFDSYTRSKFLYNSTEDWKNYVFDGEGEYTFLTSILQYIIDNQMVVSSLEDYYRSVVQNDYQS